LTGLTLGSGAPDNAAMPRFFRRHVRPRLQSLVRALRYLPGHLNPQQDLLLLGLLAFLALFGGYGLIDMSRTVAIHGIVTQTDGVTPIYAARVSLNGAHDLLSGPDGTFLFSDLSPADTIEITASFPRFETITVRLSVSEALAQGEIRVQLPRVAALSGRVVSSTAQPVGGVQLALVDSGVPLTTRSASDGSFAFPELSAATFTITYTWGDLSGQTEVTLAPEENKQDLVITVDTVNSPVTITSTPRGAALTVDGVASGVTPFSGSILAGSHLITLHYAGYADLLVPLTVTRTSANTFAFVLPPTSATPPPSSPPSPTPAPATPRPATSPSASPAGSPSGVYFVVTSLSAHTTTVYQGDPATLRGTVLRVMPSSGGAPGKTTPLRRWTIVSRVQDGTIYLNGVTYPPGPDNPDGIYFLQMSPQLPEVYGLHDTADVNQSRIGVDDFTEGGIAVSRANAAWCYANLPNGTILVSQP
jgi:lipoprotein-anchoring transpeptidase ErfK/SrfK